MRRFNQESLEEIPNLREHLHLSSSTSALPLARNETPPDPLPSTTTLALDQIEDVKLKEKEADLFVPHQLSAAIRPTTLPTRSSMGRVNRLPLASTDVDANPLRILRDKNYPIVRPRMKVNTNTVDAPPEFPGRSDSDKDSACESPSYLTTTEYTFNERDVNIHRGDTQKHCGSKEIENLNPIPLPPRDRSKLLLTNVKRHVRKHPLIIPASGLQRTLNKVKTPVDEIPLPTFPAMTVDEIDCGIKSPSLENNYNMPRNTTKPAETTKLQPMDDHSYINQEDIHIGLAEERPSYRRHTTSTSSGDGNQDFRTYENLDSLRSHMENIDSASLHFESILESHIDEPSQSPEDGGSSSSANNGATRSNGLPFDNYDVPRVNSNSTNRHSTVHTSTTSNTISDRPMSFQFQHEDFERRRMEFAEKYPNYVQPRNELVSNALFNKFRNTTPVDRNDNTVAAMRSSLPAAVGDTFNNNNSPLQSIDTLSLDGANDEDERMERKLKDSNSVSCEDLLEFSDKKPKGKERGVESDEVRIMTKVLGLVVSDENILFVCHWNSCLNSCISHVFRPPRINASSLWTSSSGTCIGLSN